MIDNPFLTHSHPSSTEGEREKVKKAQKNETKKKISDKINRTNPNRKENLCPETTIPPKNSRTKFQLQKSIENENKETPDRSQKISFVANHDSSPTAEKKTLILKKIGINLSWSKNLARIDLGEKVTN
jgi:hypothetical protein